MALLKKILHYAGFAKKDDMAKAEEFVPSDIFKHRYQNSDVLITYVKALPDGFTDDQITVKVCRLFPASPGSKLSYVFIQTMKAGQLGLKLPRKLEKVVP